MKHIFRSICLIGFLVSQSLIAAPAVFEDFSDSMSEQKFDGTEQTMEINSSGELVLTSRAKSYLPSVPRSNQASLTGSEDVKTISADLSVTELVMGNASTQQAMLRVSGTFYVNEDGNTWATINLGDRGNGLEAWYEVMIDSYDSDGQYLSSVYHEVGSLNSSDLNLNQSYSASITYDGDANFTFNFDGETPVTVSGPAKTGESTSRKGVGTRLRFGQNNSTPEIYEDEKPDDGSTVSISGTVDNVSTDITDLGDDFSAANLDKWNNVPESKIITDGQLEMAISQTNSSRHTSRVRIDQLGLKYFGAKVTLSSDSTPSDSARIRARIYNYLGNDTYDVSNGDTPNGLEGNIFTQLVIERLADGSFRAFAYISRSLDANFNTETEVLFQILTPAVPVAYDVQYTLAIEQVDKVVNYIVDGETLLSFDLATSDVLSDNLFSATGFANAQLNARVQNGPGRVVALFDDVTTDLIAGTIELNATNGDDEEVVLPTEVIVNEGEAVTLTAKASNPADVISYVWEQTSGTDVDLPVARSANNASAKVVGLANKLSFAIPSGSDTETLAFKVTTVDTAGSEASQNFALKVDNSKTPTLAATPTTPTTPITPTTSSGGGGGSFNFFFIFMLLLTFTAKLKLRSRG